MNTPVELKYSNEHEWVRVEGNKAYVGITYYAQFELGDVVFVELPENGKKLKAGDAIGVVESVKAASDIFSPVSGVVVEINDELNTSPEMVNQAPYESWIAAIEMSDPTELEKLMDHEAYSKFCMKEE